MVCLIKVFLFIKEGNNNKTVIKITFKLCKYYDDRHLHRKYKFMKLK